MNLFIVSQLKRGACQRNTQGNKQVPGKQLPIPQPKARTGRKYCGPHQT